MGLILIVLGVLIGVFIRYVLKRPGVRDDDSPQDPRRWTSGWF
jgi:hypothetical protein